MSAITSTSTEQHLARAMRHAYGLLLLTSVHHAYGAYIYDTPWRLHIVPISIGVAALMRAASGVHRRYATRITGTIALWTLCAITLVFPFGMIGFFEGGYNHVLKDLLYFGGGSAGLMQAMFPAPTYELPNSVFFELTGVAQLVPAVLGVHHLFRLIRSGFAQLSFITTSLGHSSR